MLIAGLCLLTTFCFDVFEPRGACRMELTLETRMTILVGTAFLAAYGDPHDRGALRQAQIRAGIHPTGIAVLDHDINLK